MLFIRDKIRVLCENLKEQAKQPCGDIGNLEYVYAKEYKKNHEPPKDGWEPLREWQTMQGKDMHYWIRGEFTTPVVDENKYLVLEAVTGKEGKWDATNPQGLLYLNGEMVQGYDTNHTEAFLESGTHYQMYNYFYLGMQSELVCCRMKLCSIDRRIEKLYYDVLVPYEACLLMNENSDDYIKIMGVLEQAANLVDMREIYSVPYFESIERAIAWMETEFYEKLCSTEGKPVVNYIGHTHIDVEWRWTRQQTREKIQRSFATAASLMKKYPKFKFMLSQPALYQYLKEEAPEKYEELKQLVKEGRWEPEGSMWVEPDCNLSSGESLVRQILQGKKFFKKEFGVDCKILFLPDVFGYSAAMPQILKKSGIDYFVTSKISWNETNTLPVDNFLWQGIDGTEIFSSFITAQEYKGVEPVNYTTYVGKINSAMNKGTWNRFQQKEHGNRALVTFGFGDGGGGPTKEMLEQYERLEKGLPGMPVAEMGFLLPHLQKLEKQFTEGCERTRRTPKWVGELYLEFHRGTYTSIAKNKKLNRQSELMMQMVEGLSYIDFLNGGSYDADGIYTNWNKVLHNQFHDILPGSSIYEVYENSDKDYAEIRTYCKKVIQDKLSAVASCVDAEDGVLVYNPSGFERKAIFVLNGMTVELDERIPAFGWKVIERASLKKGCTVRVDGHSIENRYYRMQLDGAGRISSLFDMFNQREVFKQGCFGNEFQAFEDFPRQYDAWEITNYYKQKMWILDETAEISPIFDGSRAGLKVVKRYCKSLITQKVWLYSDSARIDFETEIDWKEKHQLLKVAFPLDVRSNAATYDIQFGHVTRTTHENTSWDQARFESCGHKWVDFSEYGYGVSLLNDCKYGYSTEGSILKLTLLKSATFPNPYADEGLHQFTYSLLPHKGDFREANTVQEAYALNQPLSAKEISSQCDENVAAGNCYPKEYSLVSCDCENILIETVKKAENDDGMIVRMYEAYDGRGKTTMTVNGKFAKAYKCDLLENELEELMVENGKVTFDYSNFEIITLKFTK